MIKMAFSYGFYDSYKGDRKYVSSQISRIFDGLIKDGVYATVGDSFVLKESTVQNTVIVGTGRAWFDHTWNYNDADLPIECPPSEILLDRIDAIVLDINGAVSSRTNDIICVAGTPSSDPQPPSLVDETEHHQYPLGYIRRNANDTLITQSKITNTIGTDACPFVTGLLQVVSIEALLLQWKAQWEEWFSTYTGNYGEDFDTWTEEQENSWLQWSAEQKNQVSTWIEGEETQFEQWSSTQQTEMVTWINTQQAAYNQWIASIQDILDENAAGNLLLKIEDLEHYQKTYGFGDDSSSAETNGFYKVAEFPGTGNHATLISEFKFWSDNLINFAYYPADVYLFLKTTQTAKTVFTYLPSGLFDNSKGILKFLYIKYKPDTAGGKVEIYFKREKGYQKISGQIAMEDGRATSNRKYWNIESNITNFSETIEEEGYTVISFYDALINNLQSCGSETIPIYSDKGIFKPAGNGNKFLLSPTFGNMVKVSELPSDAADHPEIIYVVVKEESPSS